MTAEAVGKDFAGREIFPGDTVVYASLAGRSAKLTRGVVIGPGKSGGVKIQREETSYGGNVKKQTRYIDSRTGKGIEPSFPKHQERGYGYLNKITGRFITDLYAEKYLNYEEVKAWYQKHGYYGYYSAPKRPEYRNNPAFVEADWEFVRPIYKDYVTEVEKLSPPVTVGTHSMLKVVGEWTAPDAEES